jgi:E3 ubiquitin-protein ligase RNF146
MSQSINNVADIVNEESKDKETKEDLTCGICHDERKLSSTLSCNHSFCYLCIKGWSMKKNNCPLCRKDIDDQFLNKVELNDDQIINDVVENKYKWFYSGKKGWWAFDFDTSQQLETFYNTFFQTQNNLSLPKLRIGSVEYSYDFHLMKQISEDGKIRSIKRSEDMDMDLIKGVAGLHLQHV